MQLILEKDKQGYGREKKNIFPQKKTSTFYMFVMIVTRTCCLRVSSADWSFRSVKLYSQVSLPLIQYKAWDLIALIFACNPISPPFFSLPPCVQILSKTQDFVLWPGAPKQQFHVSRKNLKD